jgi:hypothetical protein
MGNAASYFNYEDPTYQNYKENESKQKRKILELNNILEQKKLKARSDATRQNVSNFYFLREASLRAFSFANRG